MSPTELSMRYSDMRNVALEVIRSYRGGKYYTPYLKFEDTRKYPYPLLRHAIADTLYFESAKKGEPVTLSEIGYCMHKTHASLSLGIAALNEMLSKRRILDSEAVDIVHDFKSLLQSKDADLEERSLHRIMQDLYEMTSGVQDEGVGGEVEFYEENDDTAIYLFIN